MTADRARVSVIIPVFNCEAYLAEAVESVHRQAYEDLELIIVDDGSTDGTARIAAGLRDAGVRYVYQPNGGPARARNHGLALAGGAVIGFLDADDLWPADRLRRLLDVLDRHPAIDLVLGRTQLVRCLDGTNGESDPGRRDGGARFQNCAQSFVLLSPTAALFRRRAFARVGLFDETLRYGEDTDWFMRARERGAPILVEDDIVLLYRRHRNNMTHGRDVTELRVLDVLKKSLDRRRRLGGHAASLPDLLGGRPRAENPDTAASPRSRG